MDYRIEKDTLGEVKVPADKLWGAQTERSRNNFKIGQPASMPLDIIRGFAYLKKGAAFANHELGVLPLEKRDLIAAVCDEILAGKLDDQFPLVIWQTGSGRRAHERETKSLLTAHISSQGRQSVKERRPYSLMTTLTNLSPPMTRSPRACTSPATRRSSK